MLPRRASVGDLYACGAGVHIPSIGVAHRSKSPSRVQAHTAEPPPAGPKQRRRRRHTTEGNVRDSLWHQIDVLGRALEFTEEVVSTRSPHSVSYHHARRNLRDVFQAPAVPLGRTRRVRFAEDVAESRYGRTTDARTHDSYTPLRPHKKAAPTPAPTTGNTRTQLKSHTKATSDEHFFASHHHSTYTPSTHHLHKHQALTDAAPLPFSHVQSSSNNNRLYQAVKIVPASQSVPWETETLVNLSSSTAVRLGGHKREVRGDEKRKIEEEGRVGEERGDVGQKEGEDETQREEKHNTMMQDFVTSLQLGAKPLKPGFGEEQKGRGGLGGGETERELIILDNNMRYRKFLQSSYPKQPADWCMEEKEKGKGVQVQPMQNVYTRGNRRWISLPQPAPAPEWQQWVPGRVESLSILDAPSLNLDVPISKKPSLVQLELFKIMYELAAKNSIHVQPEDLDIACIIHRLQSCSISHKLLATASVVTLLERSTSSQPEKDDKEEEEDESRGSVRGIPARVIRGLSQLLREPPLTVQVPVAITLCCLDRETSAAKTLLLQAVRSGSGLPEEWAGLQSLVVGGVCEAIVVEGLHRRILTDPEPGRRERAGQLLARLSDRMPLVHALLAEQLNSRGWQERLSACQLLPSLQCPLSSDVCSKLVLMSWEDWSLPVREASAQALGKTGHAELLHSELVRRLSEGSAVERLDALRKLHSLHLMTPRLLSVVLPCLTDHHISIKTEAIAIAGTLQLQDHQVIHTLLQLLSDSIWHIRAHTLRALNSIGYSDASVTDQLLWVVQCDKIPAVRAEACHSLVQLRRGRKKRRKDSRGRESEEARAKVEEVKEERKDEEERERVETEEREEQQKTKKEVKETEIEQEEEEGEEEEIKVITALRERLIVEDDPVVTRQLTAALQQLGASTDWEDPMLTSIQREVARLGSGAAITREIMNIDRTAMAEYVLSRPRAQPSTRDYLRKRY